jgi:hypothetical protein
MDHPPAYPNAQPELENIKNTRKSETKGKDKQPAAAVVSQPDVSMQSASVST